MTVIEEEYRPRNLDEIVGNREIIGSIKKELEKDPLEVSNMTCVGPPGVGKSTAMRIVAHTVSGGSYLRLNAGDTRRIDDMRDKVGRYVSTVGLMSKRRVVLLEEADNLTEQSKRILMGIMDENPKALFLFTANSIGKLHSPVISRTVLYEFSPITPEEVFGVVSKINEEKKLGHSEESLWRISRKCGGDLRKAIHMLSSPVTVTPVKEIFSIAVKDYKKAFFAWESSGVDAVSFLQELAVLVAKSKKLNDAQSLKIIGDIGNAEYRVVLGVSDTTVMLDFFSKVFVHYNNERNKEK